MSLALTFAIVVLVSLGAFIGSLCGEADPIIAAK